MPNPITTDSVLCIKCRKEKNRNEFAPSNLRYSIRICKICRQVIDKTRPKEPRRKYQRRADLKRRYGITNMDDYEKMVKESKGLCMICGEDNGGRTLHIDHDHATGEIRGLLCFGCNSVLGHAKDDIGILLKAAKYLLNSTSVPERNGQPRNAVE